MRASYNNSRRGSARHNGRNFKGEAVNINRAKSPGCLVWTHDAPTFKPLAFEPRTLADIEEAYYSEHFGRALNEQNEKAAKRRHRENVRSVKDWTKLTRYAPEETLLQLGTMEEHPDPETFTAVVSDFVDYLNEWSEDHGRPFVLLNIVIHLDEATPHAHVRRVWRYVDGDGVERIGQKKALQAAGVALPDPTKPRSKQNNEKTELDRIHRAKFQEIAKAHGISLETEPREKSEHLSPKAYRAAAHAKKAAIKAQERAKRAEEEAHKAEQNAQEQAAKALEMQQKAAQEAQNARAFAANLAADRAAFEQDKKKTARDLEAMKAEAIDWRQSLQHYRAKLAELAPLLYVCGLVYREQFEQITGRAPKRSEETKRAQMVPTLDATQTNPAGIRPGGARGGACGGGRMGGAGSR